MARTMMTAMVIDGIVWKWSPADSQKELQDNSKSCPQTVPHTHQPKTSPWNPPRATALEINITIIIIIMIFITILIKGTRRKHSLANEFRATLKFSPQILMMVVDDDFMLMMIIIMIMVTMMISSNPWLSELSMLFNITRPAILIPALIHL